MAIGRQVQLRRGREANQTIIDLNGPTYVLLADNGFVSAGEALEIKVRLEVGTLAELDRLLGPLRRMLTQAEMFTALSQGEPVEVWTKVCDAVTAVPEIGAGWMRKRVLGGSVVVNPLTGTAAVPSAFVTLSLQVGPTWRRALPAQVLVGTANVSARADGGITSNGAAVTARRNQWTASTGVTARYRWLAANASCDFFKVTGKQTKAWWDNAAKRFKIQDDTGTPYVAQSSVQTFVTGQEVDVVFRWNPSVGMAIWVNGVADGAVAACGFSIADSSTIFEPTGEQSVLSVQVWPTALSDAECQGLYSWGRPEPELAFVVPPADTKNTNCAYRLFNMPGDAPGGLRLLATAGANQDQLRLALRPLRAPSTLKFECEGGTLGADTAGAADADASGGNVARFTPTASTWATRATVTIVANPSGLASYLGDYVLFLACKDAAANVGDNLVRFRVNVGGVNGDWSAEVGVAGINTRSLLRLGTFSLPPGGWPEESDDAVTTGFGSAYVTVELQVKNGLGTGGGAFDLDALYLAPKETDGVASCAAWVYSTQTLALDWTGETPSGILAFDSRSLEFGGWADWEGADLTLTPTTGEAGVLWGYVYRDAAQQAWPNDTVDLTVYYEPRWRR